MKVPIVVVDIGTELLPPSPFSSVPASTAIDAAATKPEPSQVATDLDLCSKPEPSRVPVPDLVFVCFRFCFRTEEGSETNSEESIHKDSKEEVGKWALESRDPVDGIRIRLGTSFSAEEAYGVYLAKRFELQAKAMVVPKQKDEPSSVSPLKSECSGSATNGGSDIGNASPTLKDSGGELGDSGSGLELIID
ncbi:hypothetical protein U1Q18_020204 [Sarracenia purpurea var. burkii]